MILRQLASLSASCALIFSAGLAEARPFTLSDFLHRETLGAIMMDASERWLIVGTFGPYDSIQDYSLGHQALMTVGRIHLTDLQGRRGARLLFADAPEYGYQPLAFSPSGDRLAVSRTQGAHIELGVVELATGETIWTGLTPVTNLIGRTLQWRDNRTLVVLTRRPDAFAFYPAAELGTEQRISALWSQTRLGGVGLVSVGSGRYLGSHPAPSLGALMSLDVVTGQARRLSDGEFWDIEISKDGHTAAVLDAAEDLQPDPQQAVTTGDPNRRYRLRLVDLTSGQTWTPCAACEIGLGLLSWSEDARELLVFAKSDSQPWTSARYLRIDAKNDDVSGVPLGQLIAATDGGASGIRLSRGAWLAGAPVVLARNQTGRRGWYRITSRGAVELSRAMGDVSSELVSIADSTATFTARGRIWRIGPDGAPRSRRPTIGRLVSRGGTIDGTMRPTDLEQILAREPSPPTARDSTLLHRRPKGDDFAVDQAGGSGDLENVVAVGPRTGTAASVRQAADGSQVVVLRQAKVRRAIIGVNRSLDSIDLSRPQPVRHRGPHGERLTSWLYPAVGATASHKAPLVIVPYPGIVYPADERRLPGPYQNAMPAVQVLAGAGLSVLLLSMPIDHDREPSEGLADEILGAIAAVDDDVTDIRRAGLFGHSYGGYAVLAAATQSQRFGAVVAAAASPDLISKYESLNLTMRAVPDAGYSVNAGWSETGQGRMAAPPWRDPDRYVRNSPYFQVEHVTAPVLFITGDMDGNPVGARAMFNALYRLGKDAILLDYFGEGHVAYSAGNVRDQYERAITFLQERLSADNESGAPRAGIDRLEPTARTALEDKQG